MSQPFGATNKPDTCLWCGRKLPQKWINEIEYSNVSKKKCDECGGTEADYNGFCVECHCSMIKTKRHVKSREKLYDKRGRYGDGYFCGLNCGYAFAVVAAESNIRVSGRRGSAAKKQAPKG